MFNFSNIIGVEIKRINFQLFLNGPKKFLFGFNPIRPGLFWFFKAPGGGADLPPPSKNGGNGWEVPKLSWNLISYQD